MAFLAQTGRDTGGASRAAVLAVRTTNSTTTAQGKLIPATVISPSETAMFYARQQPFGIQPYTHDNLNSTTYRGEYAVNAKVVSGLITDQNGSPLARRVVAINQRTHRTIAMGMSDALGAFTLALPLSNESNVLLVAEPLSGESRNAAVFLNVAPVAAATAPGQSLTDPYFSNVVLLLHGNGTNGSTTITDNSSAARTCTPFGNAQLSNAQAMFGSTSLYFDGTSGTYITCSDIPDVNFAQGDFTVEMWARFATTPFSNNALLTFGTPGSPTFELYRRGGLNLWNGSSTVITGGTTLATNTWYHIAWVRSQGVHALFVNGNLEGTAVSNAALNPAGIILGSYTGTLDQMNGWIDDVRITNNVARYTGIFVPPAAAFQNS